MIKLNTIERAIISLLWEMPNITIADVDGCREIHGIANSTFRKYVKSLIDKGIVIYNNVAFEANNVYGKSYHKRYNLSYKYINEMTEKQKTGWGGDADMTITVKPTDMVTVKQNDRTLTWDPKEGFWRENGKRLWPSYQREQAKRNMRGEVKGEQVRVNGVKDPDLKQMIHDAGKQAKILQMEREANQDVSDEDIESLINN